MNMNVLLGGVAAGDCTFVRIVIIINNKNE